MPRIVVNDEGYLVDVTTGLVIEGCRPIEGTELWPVRSDPRVGNTSMHSGVKVSPNPKITWLRKRFSMVGGVRDEARERAREVEELVDTVMEVLENHGIKVHRDQVRDFVIKALKAWDGRPTDLVKVLDRVLDVNSNEYLEERRPIIEALSEVFGRDWLVRHYIGQVIKEWGLNGVDEVISIDEVMRAYEDVRLMAKAVRKNYYTKTLIELAIVKLLLMSDSEDSVRKFLRSEGREELLSRFMELMSKGP